jgi:ABC-type branched-subunit amino acid transport system substrate-binding protein
MKPVRTSLQVRRPGPLFRRSKETMRRALFFMALGSAHLAFAGGCAALHGLDEYSTANGAPEGTTPPSIEETGEGTTTPAGVEPGASCLVNADCTMTEEVGVERPPVPSVCVKSAGTCASLVTADCPRVFGDYRNDDAIVLGALVGDEAEASLERAIVLAAEEINASKVGGLPPVTAQSSPRPLVIVACDAAADAVRAARHLVDDLHVPAIVGPTRGEDVVDVTHQVSAKGGTLLMTPTALLSQITDLADSDLTWRVVPADSQRAKLVIEQIKDLESVLRTTRGITTVKLGIVHRADAGGQSSLESIRGKLILNGRFLDDAANAPNVSLDAYQPNDEPAQQGIATKYGVTLKPDIVFITAPEQIANVMVPLEKALTATRAVHRPYYVLTDAAKTPETLEALAGTELPADIRRRVRVVGAPPDASSLPVLEAFRTAFAERHGSVPDAAAAAAYDATYALAYALAATPHLPPAGASVAHGLRALGVGEPLGVGSADLGNALKSLSGGRPISLRGTSGLLRWDAAGDIAGGTLEVWCVGTADGALAFKGSGLTMDVQTQVVGGAFVQCQ